MRIMTWNVNSIRTLRQYYPWSEHKSYQTILEALDADILCFQEMKITRSSTESALAIIPDYDAFFSYPKKRHGYAGVATFVKTEYTPVDAEEGFSGLLRRSSGIDSAIGGYETLLDEFTPAELLELDSEGRVLITDHRLFVLFNVYFPVDDPSEERQSFRMKFYRAIRLRVEALIAAGREVVLVGDVNACHREIDHCDPKKSMKERGIKDFQDRPCRQWIHDFLHPRGPMYDAFRFFHPTQEKAFTCWNTLINARPVNYGTRIDYVLVTAGMLPWLADCTIEGQIMGSDHCPVICVMHESHPSTGVLLKVAIAPGEWTGGQRQPPKLCAKYWDEFSGKQQKLSSFFAKKIADGKPNTALQHKLDDAMESPKMASSSHPGSVGLPGTKSTSASTSPTMFTSSSQKPQVAVATKTRERSGTSALPKAAAPPSAKPGKGQPPKGGQKTLAAFFGRKPQGQSNPQNARSQSDSGTSLSTPSAIIEESALVNFRESSVIETPSNPAHAPSVVETRSCDFATLDADFTGTNGGSWSTPDAASEWKSLMKPPDIPECWHKEPAKEFRVNKTGPNQGRLFYLCARPVGPSDGTKKSLIGEFRCDFFQWKSGPKRKDSQGPGNKEKTKCKADSEASKRARTQ